MKALIIVDVQNDFLEDGSLPVSDSYSIIPIINKLMPKFDLVVASLDWHPENHISFKEFPPHCIQNTRGAQLSSDLNYSQISRTFYKGVKNFVDAFSAFYDNIGHVSTDLDKFLKEQGATQLYIVGLATDYCVRHTALDARLLEYDTTVVIDCCRSVYNANASIEEMKRVGVKMIQSDALIPKTSGTVKVRPVQIKSTGPSLADENEILNWDA